MRDLLSDDATKRILESIMTVPKSTSQLCVECKIPTSTAYRKIQKLYECGFIRRTGIINEASKRETIYKSNLFALFKNILNL